MKNNLPALRKESGITQKAIANKLNITYLIIIKRLEEVNLQFLKLLN